MGSFVDQGTIDALYMYQEKIKKVVLLVYDPLKSEQGNLSLRAYRLSEKFLQVYKTQIFTKER